MRSYFLQVREEREREHSVLRGEKKEGRERHCKKDKRKDLKMAEKDKGEK